MDLVTYIYISSTRIIKCDLQHFPLDRTSSPWNPVWRMGAGATAGTFATLLTHPIDVVRARLTIQSQVTQQYRGIIKLKTF